MVKIRRDQARKLYLQGIPFIIVPSGYAPTSVMACPIFPTESHYNEKTFDELCNEFNSMRIHFYL